MQLGAKKLNKPFVDDEEDEALTKEIEDATRDEKVPNRVQTNRKNNDDEEYAKKLQEALHAETNPKPASFYRPNNSGTFAALPKSSDNNDFQVPLEVEPPKTVVPTAEYGMFVQLKKQSNIVKMMCGVDFLFGVYALIFNQWWLSFGIVFAPLGAFGAHIFNRKLIAGYMLYLACIVILEVIFAFVKLDGLVTTLSLLFVGIQLCIMYYIFTFFKAIPADGVARYLQPDLPMQNL